MDLYKDLNKCFKEFIENKKDFKENIGEATTNIEKSVTQLVTLKIPNILKNIVNSDNYIINGSVGKGRQTATPWISVLDKNETTSTQHGVYLVFLFSQNIDTVYLTLGQGTTDDKFGHRLGLDEIKKRREDIKKSVQSYTDSKLLVSNEDIDVADAKYKECAIYCTKWNIDDVEGNKLKLESFLKSYREYVSKKSSFDFNTKDDSKNKYGNVPIETIEQIPLRINDIIDSIKKTGLLYEDKLIQRFVCSLMTKQFVILSGLAGSGKTQLALAFARVISENAEQQLCVVPVGADWTNREPLLGYPNALKQGEYMLPESGALQIMMRALRNPQKPYFLVLDEMNLSYVERYFADFLSALESHQEIPLWEKQEECDCEVPASIALPKNLFIVGTINVDETTYMFSPKVLDRANVIEFKISDEEMEFFLTQDRSIDVDAANGACANMGKDFVEKSTQKDADSSELAQKTLLEFFKVLKKVNAEFGYRSATEIYRFIANAKACAEGMTEDEILDAAIVQKLLPKLHGSRKKLEPALKALWGLCMTEGHSAEAITRENVENAKFPEAADKIQRMMQTALENGFTSFAEA